jgi:hypothetical protein
MDSERLMPSDPFYNSRTWRWLRQQCLIRDLMTCTVPGCGQLARVVDHIIARRDGGPDTLDNLRSLCTYHDHQIKENANGKRANDGVAIVKGCFPDGTPRDPNHPWYTGGPKGKGGSIITGRSQKPGGTPQNSVSSE